ncbi:MAG: tail fiber domain-containing protein [Anaerolineae bacterium]
MHTKRSIRVASSLLVLMLVLFGVGGGSAIGQAEGGASVATSEVRATTIVWQPAIPYASAVLAVSGPDGATHTLQFGPDEIVVLSVSGSAGATLPDGSYLYELRFEPVVDSETRAALDEAADSPERDAVVAELIAAGKLPAQALVQSGAFAVQDGAFVLPSSEGQEDASGPGLADVGLLDQVIPDDLIVQSSLCVGFDCISGENFGFATLRLKENNTRIHFEDTSVTAGFPANDWFITANDSASGGASYLAFEDLTAGTRPFTVMAGNANNALVVSNNRLGINTSSPALKLHIVDSDTPDVRLEQTSAGGFTAQTWDIGANEANFFVRDLTGGNRLPFRIRPGAPTSSIDISASGNVGIGTAAPLEKLHVTGNIRLDGYVLELSDVNAKEAFEPVDGAQVLEALAELPITTWAYREDPNVRHMGPMAQDFSAAFGLGPDNQHIAPLDVNGVALAAIQELASQSASQGARIAELERENAELAARLEALESLVATLAPTMP